MKRMRRQRRRLEAEGEGVQNWRALVLQRKQQLLPLQWQQRMMKRMEGRKKDRVTYNTKTTTKKMEGDWK